MDAEGVVRGVGGDYDEGGFGSISTTIMHKVENTWIFVLIFCSNLIAQNVPLDRPFTLINAEPDLLLKEHHRLISTEPSALSFIYPRPCLSFLDHSEVCNEKFKLEFISSEGVDRIGVHPMIAEEFRGIQDNIFSTESGLFLSGKKGPLEFDLDGRIFTESIGKNTPTSYDYEDVDLQYDSITGTTSFRSFSRFRGGLHLNTVMGRFSVSRDAAHWGPGVFGNLSFNQNAVPFNQVSYVVNLGPFTIVSLYGDLLPDSSQAYSKENLKEKNLYAHRLEFSPNSNLLIGLTDRLILFDQNKPLLIAPVFPLFMAKGYMYEEANNGDISFDMTWRFPKYGMIYGEFFLDDMESITSLIMKSYAQNKWASLLGFHFIKNYPKIATGLIGEYSHVEPWVYTHFEPNTSQAANLGQPLGNPLGPNSESVTGKIYLWWDQKIKASISGGFTWKGKDLGSRINDPSPQDGKQEKEFLSQNSNFNTFSDIMLTWLVLGQSFSIKTRIAHDSRIVIRSQFQY